MTIQASLSAVEVGGDQSAIARSSCGGAIQFHVSTANLGPSSISFPMAAPSSYLLLGSSSQIDTSSVGPKGKFEENFCKKLCCTICSSFAVCMH
ncbi:hypothetical protein FXO38_00882 [Capsicum annuum]|nr:hypothetical protein FXO38_00882 [Capsicum annuum]